MGARNIYAEDEFAALIGKMKAADAAAEAVDAALSGACEEHGFPMRDFFSADSLFTCWRAELVDTLERMFCDDGRVLEWWICECAYGREWEDGMLEEGGEPVSGLGDARGMYRYLVERMPGSGAATAGNGATRQMLVPDGAGGWRVNPDLPDGTMVPDGVGGWRRKGEAAPKARYATSTEPMDRR